MISDETQVKAIQRYVTKLNPEVDRLFQCTYNGGLGVGKADMWFIKSPLLPNVLSTMMAKLSEEARLSQRYTNHCVCATVISSLKRAGVGDRHICSVSGHKNLQSLQVCDRPTMSAACDMSKAIDTLDNASDSSSITASAVVIHAEKENVPPTVSSIVINEGHFKNVTFNVINKPQKRKRLSLKLDKSKRHKTQC